MRDVTEEITRAAVVPERLRAYERMMKQNRAAKPEGGEDCGRKLKKRKNRRKDSSCGG